MTPASIMQARTTNMISMMMIMALSHQREEKDQPKEQRRAFMSVDEASNAGWYQGGLNDSTHHSSPFGGRVSAIQ
jgi:hypothetical protein